MNQYLDVNILQALCQLNNIKSKFHLEQYLLSLQQYVRTLRKAYRKNVVQANYQSRKSQAAYLLAYYPHYACMTHQVFEDLGNKNYLPFKAPSLSACLFGSGPTPEAVGLAMYLRNNFPEVNNLTINTYDIAADTWQFSQHITQNYVLPTYWDNKFFTLNSYKLNLCEINATRTIQDVIQHSQLFVFQNCLNELAASPETVIENIYFIVQKMPKDSIIILADQGMYPTVTDLLRRSESSLSNLADIIRSYQEQIIEFRVPFNPHKIIQKNLLTGDDGLIPRRKIKFNYLAAQKMSLWDLL